MEKSVHNELCSDLCYVENSFLMISMKKYEITCIDFQSTATILIFIIKDLTHVERIVRQDEAGTQENKLN